MRTSFLFHRYRNFFLCIFFSRMIFFFFVWNFNKSFIFQFSPEFTSWCGWSNIHGSRIFRSGISHCCYRCFCGQGKQFYNTLPLKCIIHPIFEPYSPKPPFLILYVSKNWWWFFCLFSNHFSEGTQMSLPNCLLMRQSK